MVNFSNIEEYIQFIAGCRDINNKTTTTWLAVSPISLARYDKSIVHSFADQIEQSSGFTDRQGELAKKLVSKYRKQLTKLGVACSEDIDSIPFKFPLRVVDRTRRTFLKDGKLILQFPFDAELIKQVKEFARDSEGSITFDNTLKQWQVALTESCVNWAHAFARALNFEIAPEVSDLADLIIHAEQTAYAIELVELGDRFAITNAPESMLDYIQNNGGFGLDNRLKLLEMSAYLGYTISKEILSQTIASNFLIDKNVHISTETDSIVSIVEYAKYYNQFPIFSFNPSKLGSAFEQELNKQFSENEIVYLNKQGKDAITPATKLVHATTQAIVKQWNDEIPVLICYSNLSFGTTNSILLQNSRKVCYYTPTSYERS
jgi:hypothetical protein